MTTCEINSVFKAAVYWVTNYVPDPVLNALCLPPSLLTSREGRSYYHLCFTDEGNEARGEVTCLESPEAGSGDPESAPSPCNSPAHVLPKGFGWTGV